MLFQASFMQDTQKNVYLAALELGIAIEHLLRSRVAFHRPVEHRGGGDQGDCSGCDPPPEDDRLGDRMTFQAALKFQVEDLKLSLG